MITNYFRPKTLDEALKLLAQPDTVPLGGGTILNRASQENFAVVDLQALGLDKIHKAGNNLEIGATVTLQQLLESAHAPEALKQAIRLESALNIRNAATLAGTLVTCDGRSPFATVMLALDGKIEYSILPFGYDVDNSNIPCGHDVEYQISSIGEFLPFRLVANGMRPSLITKLTIPLNIKSAFEMVARSPADRPIVCAAVAQWASGRTRLALGGFGKAPLLALDGTESDGLEDAARSAFHEAADEWASAEYRADVAATLARRCLEQVTSDGTPQGKHK